MQNVKNLRVFFSLIEELDKQYQLVLRKYETKVDKSQQTTLVLQDDLHAAKDEYVKLRDKFQDTGIIAKAIADSLRQHSAVIPTLTSNEQQHSTNHQTTEKLKTQYHPRQQRQSKIWQNEQHTVRSRQK